MNYDITLSLSEELNVKVLDTHTFDIYDRTFTKIEEITKFSGLTLTHAYNIIKSYFNKNNPNIVANIKKSNENICISLTYTKKDEFDITSNILLIFDLDKHTIYDTEKRYNQLYNEITNLKTIVQDIQINTEKRYNKLSNENNKLKTMIHEMQINTEGIYSQLCNKNNKLKTPVNNKNNKNEDEDEDEDDIDNIYDPFLWNTVNLNKNTKKYILQYGGGCMQTMCGDTETTYTNQNDIEPFLILSANKLEEIEIYGNFRAVHMLSVRTVKKISFHKVSSTSAVKLYGSFNSLTEISYNDCQNIKTLKNKLPKKNIKIILQNISTELTREIPILKKLGYNIECK